MPRESGIIASWLLKIVLVIALVGVALFEAGAVIFATLQASNAATAAASEAVATFAHTHNTEDARADADREAAREGAIVVSFSADVARDTGQARVTVVVERRAGTLFIQKIGFLAGFSRSRASSTAYSV